MNEDKIINDKGFAVRPEYYTQEQWCQMYLTVIRIYKNLYEEHEQLKTTNESLTSLVNSCQNEIRQLQNNWNELKNILKARIDACKYCDKEFLLSNSKKEIKCLESILGDMQELEQGKDERNN